MTPDEELRLFTNLSLSTRTQVGSTQWGYSVGIEHATVSRISSLISTLTRNVLLKEKIIERKNKNQCGCI